jgi:putative FmdB family regulatory protein
MPTYEFTCESCSKTFEVTLTLTQRASTKVKCPSCGSDKVASQMTTFTSKTSKKS